jgi:hypothetical protein
MNGTDTKTSIEFLDPTILIPIPGIVPKKNLRLEWDNTIQKVSLGSDAVYGIFGGGGIWDGG